MEDLHRLISVRNAVETDPFLSVCASVSSLQSLVDTLQARCDDQDRQIVELQAAAADENGVGGARDKKLSRSESRLRDKVEKLQEQLNEKLRAEVETSNAQLENAKELSRLKDVESSKEADILQLVSEKARAQEAIEELTSKLNTAESSIRVTERQNSAMKEKLEELEGENYELKKSNDQLVGRLVTEKEGMMDQFNKMNEMLEALQKEVDMLRLLQKQQEKQASLFANGSSKLGEAGDESTSGRKWGSWGVVLPSEPKHMIKAHSDDIVGVRYSMDSDLIASSSIDSIVKIWDTSTGRVKSTLRSSSGQPMLGVDIAAELVAGCSCDKTCRVWSTKTDRMIHHLVGHANKVTCVRIFPGSKTVITGSSDRSIKVWDIARNTYRLKSTLRHGSAVNCLDVSTDSSTAVSGHVDGGLRLWDLRSGERVADIPALHAGGVSSVEFDPSNRAQILTGGRDSSLKILDARNGSVVRTFDHEDFVINASNSASCFSPDGAYVAAGSGSSGEIFVWRSADGNLKKQLRVHKAGVSGVAWADGGSSGQQVASVDKEGNLILWA